MSLVIMLRRRDRDTHAEAQRVVEQNGDLARRGGHRLRLPTRDDSRR